MTTKSENYLVEGGIATWSTSHDSQFIPSITLRMPGKRHMKRDNFTSNFSCKLSLVGLSLSLSVRIKLLQAYYLHSSFLNTMYQIFMLIFLFDTFSSFAHAKCYLPSGKEMEKVYRPCSSGKEFDTCCNGNMDECRPDGLCVSKSDQSIWRIGCTDPTWESSSCIKLCTAGLGIVLDISF